MSKHDKKECKAHMRPITDTLELVGGKWKLPILFELMSGKRRFMELQREIGGVTAKMLSKELKDLEMNQLVARTVYPTTPVTVEYSMTEYGHTLGEVIRSLHNWGAKHRARILDGAGGTIEPMTDENCNARQPVAAEEGQAV